MEQKREETVENSITNDNSGTLIIPVIEEHVTFSKEVVETGKVTIAKRVIEEEVTLNIPLIQEGYNVQRMPASDQLYDTPPPVRHEGENMVIPVVEEVAVLVKKYKVVEELHVIKTKTEVPHMQQITLLKEEVSINREAIQNK